MNRRGFIALATAAAVVPQELIAAAEPAPVLSEAALESILLEIPKHATKVSILPTRFVLPAEFLEQLREILNEEFSKAYECVAWEDLFEEDSKTLAGEGGGRGETIPRREEAGPTSQDVALESRRAGGVYNPVGAFEGARPNLRERG